MIYFKVLTKVKEFLGLKSKRDFEVLLHSLLSVNFPKCHCGISPTLCAAKKAVHNFLPVNSVYSKKTFPYLTRKIMPTDDNQSTSTESPAEVVRI